VWARGEMMVGGIRSFVRSRNTLWGRRGGEDRIVQMFEAAAAGDRSECADGNCWLASAPDDVRMENRVEDGGDEKGHWD